MLKWILTLVFSTSTLFVWSQQFQPRSPLDIPIVLSGTFGELRGNHFHSGIDIKTQGKSGLKVRAVADGHVARIAVRPYGYGNALYIQHPEGYTTVYAHLQSFAPEIEAWVEEQLRDRSKNEANLYPPKSLFQFSKGDLIAFSGNSGGSMGPHLHFEIRETKSEHPLNPLDFNIRVADSRAPSIRGLSFTMPSDTRWQTFHDGDTVDVPQVVGLNVHTTDRQDGANNNNGVYKIEAQCEEQTIFRAHYSQLNFSTTRYINAHIHYRHYTQSRSRWTRLHALPNNPLRLQETPSVSATGWSAEKGWISIEEGQIVHVLLRIEDQSGNLQSSTFYLRGTGEPAPLSPTQPWNEDVQLDIPGLSLRVPAKCMYQDEELLLLSHVDGTFSAGNSSIPLQSSATISAVIPKELRGKAGLYLLRIGAGGATSPEIGEIQDSIFVIQTRNLGQFKWGQDVDPPTLSVLQHSPLNRPNSTFREIRIVAKDVKTGIDRYSARIDGEFVRIDYDYKRNLLKVILPTELAAGKHNLRVVAIDALGNTETLETTIAI